MVCDWKGAGRAQGVRNYRNVKPWYEKNKDKIRLHVQSRKILEDLI